MQVFVKTLAGETLTLAVEASMTVQDVKAQISALQAIPADSMRIVCEGKSLCDAETLLSQEVACEATFHVVMDLDGGKKKKKKVYTTPKKIKHKNKKIKLRVLNFYKVDDKDNITRTRTECPKCGAGYFMASHANRYHCGNCYYTVAKSA